MSQIINMVNGVVYMPTIQEFAPGFYMGVDPVAVVKVSDTAELAAAIREAMVRPVPVVPMPPRDAYPRSSTLKLTKLRSWAAFNRAKTCWIVRERDGAWQIAPQRNKKDGQGTDKTKLVIFPIGTSVDEVADKACELIQEKAREIGQL